MVDDLSHPVAIVGTQAATRSIKVAAFRYVFGPDEQNRAWRDDALDLDLWQYGAHDRDGGDAVGGEPRSARRSVSSSPKPFDKMTE